MGVVLRVLAIWLALNLVLVSIAASIGWFARRARGELRRRRAEVALTVLATAAVLGALSLANPSVRQAVSPIVSSALGLTSSSDVRHGLGTGRTSPAPVGDQTPGRTVPTPSGPSADRTSKGSANARLTPPIVARKIHPFPSVTPSSTPEPCPSDAPAPTGSTGPAPSDAPPTCSPSPSPPPSDVPSP